VAGFKKINSTSFLLEDNEAHLVESYDVSDEFAKPF
jgi:hypothetical protein